MTKLDWSVAYIVSHRNKLTNEMLWKIIVVASYLVRKRLNKEET